MGCAISPDYRSAWNTRNVYERSWWYYASFKRAAALFWLRLELWHQRLNLHQFGVAIKIRVEKELDGPSVVDDGEPGLLRLIETRAAPDDLLELNQRADRPCEHNILAGRY